MKLGAGLWIFGGAQDRFTSYRKAADFTEQLKMASQVRGLQGVELQYPRHFIERSPAAVATLCREANLQIIAIQPDIFRDPIFKYGALCATDSQARSQAVDICCAAAEVAQQVQAPLLAVWPGQDGFDYPFQVDYVAAWEHCVASLAAIADRAQGVKVAIEYKLKEPRQKSLLGSAAQTFAAVRETGRTNLGVLLDFGHSLMAKESPAQVATMLLRAGKLFHIHLNDCYGETDDDLMVGAVHTHETVELFHYLTRMRYEGWMSLDTVAFREDPLAAAQASWRALGVLMDRAKALDPDRLSNIQMENDAAKAVNLMTDMLA